MLYMLAKFLITFQLMPGILLLMDVLHASGLIQCEGKDCSSKYMDPTNIDKFGRAMANFNAFTNSNLGFNIIPSVVSFKLFVACCKILGVFAMWSTTINSKFLGGARTTIYV